MQSLIRLNPELPVLPMPTSLAFSCFFEPCVLILRNFEGISCLGDLWIVNLESATINWRVVSMVNRRVFVEQENPFELTFELNGGEINHRQLS